MVYLIKTIMSASCAILPETKVNGVWTPYRTTLNQYSCKKMPGYGAFNSLASCQQGTADCAHVEPMFARWAVTAPVAPGKWQSRPGMPYGDCQRWGGKSGLCVPSPAGQYVGATPCVQQNSPFVYEGPTY